MLLQREHQAQEPPRRTEVWFQDESRFGQQGCATRVWQKTGSRPRAVRQTQYDYLWAMGAVCPETGQVVGLLVPSLDTMMVNQYLEMVSEAIQPDVQAVLIWDGAGFHTSKDLEVPRNITLIQLPAYSPELNPMENLWHYLKSHYWSNRCYADYTAMLDALQEAWRAVWLFPEKIIQICAAPTCTQLITRIGIIWHQQAARAVGGKSQSPII